MTAEYELDVSVPVYNEGANIRRTLDVLFQSNRVPFRIKSATIATTTIRCRNWTNAPSRCASGSIGSRMRASGGARGDLHRLLPQHGARGRRLPGRRRLQPGRAGPGCSTSGKTNVVKSWRPAGSFPEAAWSAALG